MTLRTLLSCPRLLEGFSSWKADEVMGLYVAPVWARRGIGAALLARAEADIVAAGYSPIRIGASLTGKPFYEAHGYRVVADRKWKTRGGLEIDVVDLEKNATPMRL